ncbi:MAG: gamma-glutamylcyclotransferase [Alphaproteobacteria bacterium]
MIPIRVDRDRSTRVGIKSPLMRHPSGRTPAPGEGKHKDTKRSFQWPLGMISCGTGFAQTPHGLDTDGTSQSPVPSAPVYWSKYVSVQLEDGRQVRALTFVANPTHPQYVGLLSQEEKAQLVRQGHGQTGSAREYLATTVEHLDGLGIRDTCLHELLALADLEPVVADPRNA